MSGLIAWSIIISEIPLGRREHLKGIHQLKTFTLIQNFQNKEGGF